MSYNNNGNVVPAADPLPGKKTKLMSSRSWVSIVATGESETLDVDKYAIMHRVQIHARDLRILDPNLSYPSTILGRERAIVLNLEVRIVRYFILICSSDISFLCFFVWFHSVIVLCVCVCGVMQHIKAIITSEEVGFLLDSFVSIVQEIARLLLGFCFKTAIRL